MGNWMEDRERKMRIFFWKGKTKSGIDGDICTYAESARNFY